MFDKVFYATHPDMMAQASNAELRDRYLIGDLFTPGRLNLNYLHQERLVIGGAMPTSQQAVALPLQNEPASLAGAPFLHDRELGVVNVGDGASRVVVDGVGFDLQPFDALYVGRGAKDVCFEAMPTSMAARFYLASTPAHATHETRLLKASAIRPLERGRAEASNARLIYQFVIPGVCASAQLLMGLTVLRPGNVWNTMPPHLHDRRSEAYFYFRLPEGERIFHFMGEPDAVRGLVVSNEEAVICPPWSVHFGAGTQAYAFIWAMGGENLDYNDMIPIDICQLH